MIALALARLTFEAAPLLAGEVGRPWVAALIALVGAALAGELATQLAKSGRLPFVAAHAQLLPTALPLLLPVVGILDPQVNLLRMQTLLIGAVVACAASVLIATTPDDDSRRSLLVRFGLPALVAAALFGLYSRTLAPTVGQADTFEFQVAVARMAVAHPTGYPLFILIGKVFSLLPLGGTLAYRVSWASAAFGVAAALLAIALLRRLGADRVFAAIGGLLVGVSPTLWSRSVEAEVYSLHAAMTAGVLLLCLRLVGSSTDRGRPKAHSGLGASGRENAQFPNPPQAHVDVSSFGRWSSSVVLPLLGLAFGLGLSNHLTTILLAPAIGLALLIVVARQGWSPLRIAPARAWLITLAAFALGLSVYLYIPLRWPAINGGEVMTWEMFRDYITGREPQGALRVTAFLDDPSRYLILARKVLAEFGPPGGLLAILGMAGLVRREWPAALVTFAAYLGLSYFPLSFYVPDPDFSAFLIAPHLIEAVWIGLGAWELARGASAIMPRFNPNGGDLWARQIIQAAFLLLPLSLVWTSLPRVDKSGDWEMHRLGEYMLSQPLDEGALILADSQKIAPLYYLQVAEGVRPDLDIRVLPDEAAYRAALDEALAIGQTSYLGRYLPGLAGLVHMRSVGPLVEVSLSPFDTSMDGATPLNISFGQVVRLLGFRLDGRMDDRLPLTLYWRAEAAVDGNHLVRLRMVDADGRVGWESTPRVPAGGLNPTFAWPAGEIISDFHFVDLDPALRPGEYSLQAGLFLPFSETALLTSDGHGWAEVLRVNVEPTAAPPVPTHLLRANYGGLWLMGYDLPESVPPGGKTPLTLYWLADGRTSADVRIRGGAKPLAQTLDLASWPAGQVVPVNYSLRAPVNSSVLHLDVEAAGSRPVCAWLTRASHGCALPAVLVQGEAAEEGAIDFADRILLTDVSVDTPEAAPGGLVEVSIAWRGLRAMDEDYTAFVHLIGPDGLVHGQVDSWPVSGTRATSSWNAGEAIQDHYSIRVPADAPVGEYRVEIGWYLLATLDRLPVLDADGNPVDDKLLVEGLTVR